MSNKTLRRLELLPWSPHQSRARRDQLLRDRRLPRSVDGVAVGLRTGRRVGVEGTAAGEAPSFLVCVIPQRMSLQRYESGVKSKRHTKNCTNIVPMLWWRYQDPHTLRWPGGFASSTYREDARGKLLVVSTAMNVSTCTHVSPGHAHQWHGSL